MNLPFVLDIAISLIFIYLVLSLLASEIQELLTTFFQWRAKHLKEAIAHLLDGGQATEDDSNVNKLVEELYDNPLLKNVNQEARGFGERLFRKVAWLLPNKYLNFLHKNTNVLEAKRSGPSYISSETFATTLIETLKIPTLIKKLVESRLDKLFKQIIIHIKHIAERSDLNLNNDNNFNSLINDLVDIVNHFKQNEATLLSSIERMSASLDKYIKSYYGNDSLKHFIEQLQSFKLNLFGENNQRVILVGRLKPHLKEIVAALDTTSEIHKEIKATIIAKDSEEYQEIEKILSILPQSVQHSLAILARRTETRVQKTENEIHQLVGEVSIWFDRSMERASGVYKRNAKGVAILIGLVIAFAINADTLHIFNRLSSNDALRQVITERAGQAIISSSNSGLTSQFDLEKIKNETDSALKDISLPIGWNPNNLSQQLGCNFT